MLVYTYTYFVNRKVQDSNIEISVQIFINNLYFLPCLIMQYVFKLTESIKHYGDVQKEITFAYFTF